MPMLISFLFFYLEYVLIGNSSLRRQVTNHLVHVVIEWPQAWKEIRSIMNGLHFMFFDSCQSQKQFAINRLKEGLKLDHNM